MKHFILTSFVVGLLVIQPILSADILQMDSGEKQVQLIELYTSQGCSSCPPAERWLNDFSKSDNLWRKVVPLAFHVDYWDYLGWKDRYASSEYSSRQRLQHLSGAVRSVYTPGFVVDGREWKGWFSRRSLPAGQESSGRLTATLNGNNLTTSYHSEQQSELILNVVLLGFDIQSKITAGENHGRTLPHEFVVLNHQQHLSDNGNWWSVLPENPFPEVKRLALALWVTSKSNLRPLQATGSWLASDTQ